MSDGATAAGSILNALRAMPAWLFAGLALAQSIEVGKFGRLVVCLRLSDLGATTWRGEKAGIVFEWSKRYPLCYPLLSLPDAISGECERAVEGRKMPDWQEG